MGRDIIKKASNVFDRILDITAVCSGILIIFLILSVCGEVTLRYFFNSPTKWVTEVGAIIMLCAPLLVAAWVLREGRHVTMDMVVSALNPKAQKVLNIITSTIAALICAVITFFGIRVVVELFQTDTRMETYLMWLKWPFMAVIPLSTFFLFIEFLRRIFSLTTSEDLKRD